MVPGMVVPGKWAAGQLLVVKVWTQVWTLHADRHWTPVRRAYGGHEQGRR